MEMNNKFNKEQPIFRDINIKGIGCSLPNQKILTQDIEKNLKLEEGYISKLTGLSQRFFCENTLEIDTLCQTAIQKALSLSNMSLNEISCIICSGASSLQTIPYNAAYIHKLVKANHSVATFDINMTCLSVLRAFDVASYLTSTYNNILIVSIDIASIGLDWSQIRTAGIFGDGVSAIIVGKKDSTQNSGGILTSNFETHSNGYEYCQIKGCGIKSPPKFSQSIEEYQQQCYFEMDGKKLYKLASQIVPNFIYESLSKINLTLNDIDWIVPHQASKGSLEHIKKILNLDNNKFIDIFSEHGNQVASSIPFALAHLLYHKPIKSKDKILIVGTSAGVGLGLVVWEKP